MTAASLRVEPGGAQPGAASIVCPPPLPALVIGQVSHTRYQPLRHGFRHEHFQWLVDLDARSPGPWPLRFLTRIDPRDHLDGGRLGGGIRGDVERFLADRGIDLQPSDRVLMLANARVLGHTFDPLSVFWCLGPGGVLKALVFEVHNTYGGRHAYLLDMDQSGDAAVDKVFYVSPFNDVSGRYDVRIRLTPHRVSVSVRLDRAGQHVMTASTSGVPIPATTRSILATTAHYPLMTQRVSLLIRWHGIRLWLRRLAVHPRPPHTREEPVR